MFVLLLAVLASPPEAVPPPASDADKVICKREPVLGSRLKFTKTCKTKAEWKAYREAMGAQKRDIQNSGLPTPTG